ncbi:SusC/RagA family TonB-linked outer membrane protein [Persicobacter psychrovividus]|uniref:SusC/RagA family TonB-linked outer membrane protein n=1 Tax=Persicobacter psychrovividus TaxID=387638 RepID=A0ABM7VCI1_9BACT|nr:SusC/RagA family TonB-linked outer membrane protein [Persicobacter psychrovividus]
MRQLITLLLLLTVGWAMPSFTMAQKQVTVKGLVTDADTGEGLIGVNVILKGTTSGVVTDYNGQFRFGGLTSTSELQFTYMGYTTQTVKVGNKSIVDVQMKSEVKSLQNVVVFGESQKDVRTITGSVGKIDTKVFSAGTPSGSFDQLLQGQVAGLSIQASGEPGEQAKIRIRGNNSMGVRAKDDAEQQMANNANEPLYILNGAPISSDVFNTINPDDIVDIKVLKDGLSTVQYGTRGANGVIEIKTKKGIVGKTTYNIRYQHTIRPIGGLGGIELMDSKEKLAMERELSIVDGLGFKYSPHQGDSPEVIAYKQRKYQELEGKNTNWLNELSRAGQVKDLQMSMSGGSDNTRYYLSASYYDEEGGYLNSWAKRYTTRFNIDHNLRKNLTLGVDASIGRSQRSKSSTSPARLIYTLQPYETTSSESFVARQPNTGSVNFINPFDELYKQYSEYDAWRIDMNSRLNWTVMKGLNLKTEVGFTFNDGENDQVALANPDAIKDTQKDGSFSKNQSKSLTTRLNMSANYIKSFGEKSMINASVGTEYIHDQNWGFGFRSVGLADKVAPIIGANPDSKINSSLYENALLGFYGQGNYSYAGKYDLTGSFRYDGSSILPKDKRFVPAWGAGASWNIQQEDWMKDRKFFDQLRMRVSYGVNYNSAGIRQTLGMPFYDFTNSDTYRGQRTVNLTEFYNPDLKFERTKQWSVAMDFGILDHRLYGTIEAYIKNTDDLLSNISIPLSNGYGDLLQNIGALENKGIELNLSAVPIRTDHFRWTSSLNVAYNVNKITDLYGQDEIRVGTEGLFKVGEPINSAFVKHWAGVNPVNGQPIYYDEKGRLVPGGFAPQVTGFGTYDQPLTGGWTNIFTYKNLEVSTLFTYAWGGVNYNNLKSTMIRNVKNGEVPYGGFLGDIWLHPGDVKPMPYPKFFTDTSVNSLFLENASYIRWKNVIVRYNLQEKLHLKGVTALKLTAQANNILTITNYQGIDPEVTGIGQPLWRSFTLGFDLTF